MTQNISRAFMPALFIIVLFFAGCTNPVEPVTQTNSGAGTVQLMLAAPSPRTLLPNQGPALLYTIEAVKGSVTQRIDESWAGSSAKTFSLETGTWTITVTGYVSEGGTQEAISRGSGTVTISAGGTEEVTISLSRLEAADGAGTLVYGGLKLNGITLSGLSSASLTVESADGSSSLNTIDLKTGYTADSKISDLTAGYYILTIRLVRFEYEIAAKSELVHIYKDRTTKIEDSGVLSFSADDFTIPDTFEVETAGELSAALTVIQSSPLDEFFILVTGNFSTAPLSLSSSGFNGKSITIRSRDATVQTISLNSNGSLFTVGSSTVAPTLILETIILMGRSDNSTSLIRVEVGTLVLKSGGKITGNTAFTGGGVYVSSGTFTMTGGEISGNTAGNGGGVYVSSTFTMTGGAISGNTSSSFGSGVYVGSNGTFTMNDGEISGGSSSGVYVVGTFTMNGGAISGNTASRYGNGGGGVYVYSGTFTMTGGAISGNTAPNAGTGGGGRGGGVYVDGSGTFMMTGGEISGNTASRYGENGGLGGGVYVYSSGTFTKAPGTGTSTSGIIYGSDADAALKNTAVNGGAAVYVDSSPVKQRNVTAGETVSLDSASSTNWE
jgi:hypothetical protein